MTGNSHTTHSSDTRHSVVTPLTIAVGVFLALAVSVIHVLDQGGITELKDPSYLGYGYWILELAGIAVPLCS